MVCAAAVTLLFLFFIFSSYPVSAQQYRQYCTPSCGEVTINYPFSLKGDPWYCGYHKHFELTCDSSNHTILNLQRQQYIITDISYQGDSLKMHVFTANKRNSSCPLLPSSPHMYNELISSDYYIETWANFVNCSKEVKNNSMYRPLSCLSHDNSGFIYVIISNFSGGSSVGDIQTSCRFLAYQPLLDDDDDSRTDMNELLSQGFNLYPEFFDNHFPTRVIPYCLRRSLRFTYEEMQNGSLLNRIRSFSYGVEPKFINCINSLDSMVRHFKLVIKIVTILVVIIQFVKVFIVLAVLGRLLFAPLTIHVFLFSKFYQMISSVDNVEKFLRKQQTLVPTRYSYTGIIAMTGHFKEKLGQGGFGSVFKGRLPWDHLIAIKMLGKSKHNNGDEFINEVSTIGRIHHVNVVKLIGFCSDGPQRALVYEYMPNGSLDKFIFSSNNGPNHKFSLEKLIDIALGVARGIDYLHKGCDMQILHFDIKPHNILLDHNFNPKVSDFGLAKLYPRDYSLVTVSVARGTIGYIAPELISRSFGLVSHKSDVYSFGMLLLEMAGGRRNADPRAENTSQVYYPSWIYNQLNPAYGEIEIDTDIVIKDLEKKLCMVGLWCIQMRPSHRPSMSKVVEMLEGDLDSLQMPPKPFFSAPEPKASSVSCLTTDDGELTTIVEDEH